MSSPGTAAEVNTAAVDTSVASEAREKYTAIRGKGQDEVTIMVYMCGTDLESRSGMATRDLAEMAKANIASNVHVVVYTGGCSRWNNNIISTGRNQIYEVQSGGLTQLDLLHLFHLADAVDGNGVLALSFHLMLKQAVLIGQEDGQGLLLLSLLINANSGERLSLACRLINDISLHFCGLCHDDSGEHHQNHHHEKSHFLHIFSLLVFQVSHLLIFLEFRSFGDWEFGQ